MADTDTASEAAKALGRRGGHATVSRHGVEHMRKIGKRGGEAYRERMTDEDFRDEDAERRKR